MRSPRFVAIAVRRPDGKIVVRSKPSAPWSQRFPILKRPVLRGVATLLESMVQGMEALSFSAQIAGVEESSENSTPGQSPGQSPDKSKDAPLSRAAIMSSMAFAFVVSMALFVAFPHLVSSLVADVQSPVFHAIDGVMKVTVLLLYMWVIGRIPEIHRVFQFHGAEHQSIYTFEAGEALSVENAAKHTRLHPRCGTSFLLFLVLISIATFTIVFPVLGFTQFSHIAILNHLAIVGLKIVLMLPIAGVAYEFIRTCAGHMDRLVFRAMIWPGMQLQYLTTRAPDPSQLEVALVSLKEVLYLEKQSEAQTGTLEKVVAALDEIPDAGAQLAEFPE